MAVDKVDEIEDIEEIKTTLAARYAAQYEREAAARRSMLAADPQVIRKRRMSRRKLPHALQDELGSDAHKTQLAAKAALDDAIAARRQALSLLALPFTSTFVPLYAPFLIWDYGPVVNGYPHPNLDIFRGSLIQPGGSWAQIEIDT